MRIRSAFAAALLAVAPHFVSPAYAVPGQLAAKAEAAEPTQIIFDPPLDQPMRFRIERVVERDGKREMTWKVTQATFSKGEGGGYRLLIDTIDSGNEHENAEDKAMNEKLAELEGIPFVLTVSEEASITGVENLDRYWTKIFDAVESVLAERPALNEAVDPKVKERLKIFMDTMRAMPPEQRVAMATRDLQPLVEFGNTQWTLGQPVLSEFEAATPFGAKVKREVGVTLVSAKDDMARLSIRSEVPRAEFEKVLDSIKDKLGAASSTEERAKTEAELKKNDHFMFKTEADYDVSLFDGVLSRYQSTETVEFGSSAAPGRRITFLTILRTD